MVRLPTGSTSCEVYAMPNVFERLASYDDLEGVPLADYEPYQLASHMLKNYPGDPGGALRVYYDNHEVGFILYNTTLTLLEGMDSVKRNKVF